MGDGLEIYPWVASRVEMHLLEVEEVLEPRPERAVRHPLTPSPVSDRLDDHHHGRHKPRSRIQRKAETQGEPSSSSSSSLLSSFGIEWSRRLQGYLTYKKSHPPRTYA